MQFKCQVAMKLLNYFIYLYIILIIKIPYSGKKTLENEFKG